MKERFVKRKKQEIFKTMALMPFSLMHAMVKVKYPSSLSIQGLDSGSFAFTPCRPFGPGKFMCAHNGQ